MTSNVHEQFNREVKKRLLIEEIDRQLARMSNDPHSEYAARFVAAFDDALWIAVAKEAKCNPPSETTRQEVRAIYRQRAALSRLSAESSAEIERAAKAPNAVDLAIAALERHGIYGGEGSSGGGSGFDSVDELPREAASDERVTCSRFAPFGLIQ